MILDTLAPIIENSMERWAVPGLAIGILEDGQTCATAYGVRDLETEEPVTSETMFGVGSISKMFTATTAVRMADEGRLDLDQPVEALAETATIPAALRGAGVSLRHLLSHRSGLDGDGFADFGNDDQALERYLASLDHVGTLFPAGASWSYANIGTCIAGHILSCVAGLPFETLVQREILAPLGLSRTGFGQAPMPDNVATGYDHGPGEEPKPHPAGTTWRSANPAGGMVSTIGNLLRFAAFHMSDGKVDDQQVISQEALQSMQQPLAQLTSVDRWGLGWAIRSIGDVEVIEHGGWMDGYRARLTLLPRLNTAIAILNNGGFGHAANDEILAALLERHFGAVDSEPTVLPLAESEVVRFVGQYRSSHVDITIRPETAHLSAFYKTAWHENDGAEIELRAVAPNELIIMNGEFKDDRIVLVPELEDQDRKAIRFLSRVLYAV